MITDILTCVAGLGSILALCWCVCGIVIERQKHWREDNEPEKRVPCEQCGISVPESKLVGIHGASISHIVCRGCWGNYERSKRNA